MVFPKGIIAANYVCKRIKAAQKRLFLHDYAVFALIIDMAKRH